MSTVQVRELVESGKIEGGIMPDGEMVVTEESLPQIKSLGIVTLQKAVSGSPMKLIVTIFWTFIPE